MNDVKLTKQEQQVVNYLCSKNNSKIFLEELAQFAKDPQNVKRKTILRTVSEIKKKYQMAGGLIPFNVTFGSLVSEIDKMTPQPLVQVKRTPAGNMMKVDANKPPIHPAHVDFVLDYTYRRVRTRNGYCQLNENEWEVFKYIHTHVGRIIPISELRDQVVYPKYGSKLPARWFDAIMRIINNLRRQVSGLNQRIMTVKGAETSYLFQ
jgi:hypothetical protein